MYPLPLHLYQIANIKNRYIKESISNIIIHFLQNNTYLINKQLRKQMM